MTCEESLTLISAYIDRELDPVTSLDIERHLRSCDRCTGTLQAQEVLRSALNNPSLVFTPPPELEQRVRAAIRRDARSRTAFMRRAGRWMPLAAAAGLAAALTWTVASTRTGTAPQDLLLAELVSGHVRSLMVDHLVDVASSDQHNVKPWFNGKVDFAPLVADFTTSGFPLVGGRVDYIAGRPVAALAYKRRQHVVNIFVWPADAADKATVQSFGSQGYHLLHWTASGLTYWAVSDVNAEDLEALAHLFQAAS